MFIFIFYELMPVASDTLSSMIKSSNAADDIIDYNWLTRINSVQLLTVFFFWIVFHNGMGVKAQSLTLKLDHGLLNYFCAVDLLSIIFQAF